MFRVSPYTSSGAGLGSRAHHYSFPLVISKKRMVDTSHTGKYGRVSQSPLLLLRDFFESDNTHSLTSLNVRLLRCTDRRYGRGGSSGLSSSRHTTWGSVSRIVRRRRSVSGSTSGPVRLLYVRILLFRFRYR